MSPTRSLTALLVFALLVSLSPARAEEDDPVFRDRKLSEWVNLLQNGKTEKERRAGLLALRIIGPRKSRKVTSALIAAVRENSEQTIRSGAAEALGYFAAKAREDDDIPIDKIRDALTAGLRTDKAGSVRKMCARALGDMKSKAFGAADTLALALKDAHAGTRTEAASALNKLGKDAFEAVNNLQAALKDAKLEALTRVYCANALGRIGSPNALPAVPALQEALGDAKNSTDLRKACAQALGEMGKDAAAAAPTLATVLTAKDSEVVLRRSVVEALDTMGAEARPALPALRTALKDDDQFVRTFTLHAISRMGGELGDDRKAIIRGMMACMDDNVLEVRIAAIEALSHLGTDGLGDQVGATVNRLTEATRDPQKAISDAAKLALKKVQGMP
ncbi:MAG TPA: HEAT repeat domain-containing protein [Gemmataceae bacterium]|jgi:HEAT repeat protein